MKKLASIIILCLGCLGILGAQNIWTPINVPGKIYGVAANGDIFANSYEDGILCRSQDGGQTWQPTFGSHWFYDPDAFMAISGHGRIFANPVDDDICYSDDGGDHWTRQATSPGNWYPMTGLYAPTNDTLLYWGEGILAYTLDNGQIWDTANMDFITGNARISDVIANEAGDVYVSLYHNFQTEGVGVFHSTLSDMQNWELVAFEGVGVKEMEFDPEGNVLCGVYFGGEFSGFEHVPGFYAFWASSFGVSDNGIIYKLNTTANNTAVLAYSLDHGEHFTEIGEEITLEEPAPGGDDGFLFKGRDNRLYCYGNEQYYKSICNADYIYEQPAFAPMGAEWYFHVLSQGPITQPPFYYLKSEVTGVEEVQGHTCSVIDGNEYVYEEDGIVYWYNPSDDVFTVLYDFNAEVGDSWICDVDEFQCLVTVQSVDSVTWDGHTYRTQYVTGYNDDYGIVLDGRIIEGIGYEKGLFPRMEFDGPEYEYMRCYLVDGEMLYHEGDYDCDEEAPVSTTFQSGNLVYTIISTNPPHVSVAGHVDGTNAQGELDIPSVVTYEGITYTVTEIGEWAFKNCTGLTGQLTIPSTIDTIQEGAFYGCSGFTGTLDLSFSTVVFKEHVFRECSGFTELILPLFISEIPQGLFGGCSGLTGTLSLPETVEIIGEGAFARCTGYTGLVLPSGLREIREQAFAGCTGFTGNLVFPETVTHIKYEAFGHCSGFSGDLIIPNSVVELGNTQNSDYYINPEPYSTFEDCFDHLVLSQSLDTIGPRCFAGCSRLTGDLVMPEGLKAVFSYAFEGCTGLTGLTLNDSLAIIGPYAFSGCNGIQGTVTFPENISIGHDAFEWCEGIEALVLPHNMYFTDNSSLRGYVFVGCTGLTELDIPEGWTRTEQSNFAMCSNLQTVHLPESLTAIDGSSFSECTSLSEINIPEGVTEIGNSAFSRCSSLAHIELPVGLRTLGGLAFADCISLFGELVIPDMVQRIDLYTFRSDSLLTRVVLGDSINWIAEPAFENTELDSLVIKAMTPPELRRMTTQGAWHFPADIPIIVPCGTLEAYQNAEGWSDFTNIIEDCGNGLVGFSGAEWYYEIQNINGSITYQHLEYAADTTVNHKDVQIIIRTNTLYDKDAHTEVTREYIYEEDNVVYWWNKDLQDFTVLYNLDAEVGDEWEIKVGLENLTMHVDGVEQYYYDGRLFRMLRVSDEEDLFSGVIVCGIGHLTSFFPEKLMNRGKNFRVEGMRCYWRNGELFFKYGDEDCDAVYKDYHFGLDEQEETVFAVYPNPTHGVLIVETQCFVSQPIATEYRITNLMGQTLMSGTIIAETQQIDVTNLPDGMYFITVGDATRKFVVR